MRMDGEARLVRLPGYQVKFVNTVLADWRDKTIRPAHGMLKGRDFAFAKRPLLSLPAGMAAVLVCYYLGDESLNG